MFPIFPLICLTSAFTIEILSKLISGYSLKLSNIYSNLIMVLIAIFSIASISRGVALFKSFNAPFDVYMSLESVNDRLIASQNKEVINLCVGKEWHRYPSSFFLPDSKRWKLRYLQSEFRGQLPQLFNESINGTRMIQDGFNDQNLEENARYIESVNLCHLIIDTDYPEYSDRDHPYSKDPESFKVVFSSPFLDTSKSKPIWRSFYIPVISETKLWSFINYNLLQNVNMTLDLSNL